MLKFWVIDTKATMSPDCSINFEGYDGFYYGRSIVPSESADEAAKSLTAFLKEDHIEVVEVIAVVDYGSKSWDASDDEIFSTEESYEMSKSTNSIRLGSFISEETLREW